MSGVSGSTSTPTLRPLTERLTMPCLLGCKLYVVAAQISTVRQERPAATGSAVVSGGMRLRNPLLAANMESFRPADDLPATGTKTAIHFLQCSRRALGPAMQWNPERRGQL